MKIEQAAEQFGRYLSDYPANGTRRDFTIHNIRKAAVQAGLKHLGVDRVTKLTNEDADLLAIALGVTVIPEEVVLPNYPDDDLEDLDDIADLDDFAEPGPITREGRAKLLSDSVGFEARPDDNTGPAFSLAHASQLAEMTGINVDITTRFLEGKADGLGTGEIAVRIRESNSGLTNLGAMSLVTRIAGAYRQIEEQEAERDGRLWNILAVILRDRSVEVFCKQGSIDDEWINVVEGLFADRVGSAHKTVIGSEAVAATEADGFVSGTSTTLRMIPAQ